MGELCKGNCVGSYVGQWVGLRGRAVWVGGCGWRCARELCGGMHTCHQMVRPYTHNCLQYSQHKGDSPLPSHPSSPSHPAHSSSQVVHCRVCPPHLLHPPVLVLHLAVYPASPTQGRAGLTDRLSHSAQTQCNQYTWCRAILRDIALCAVKVVGKAQSFL